jgi:ketosteroid isomerase-like protein
MRTRHNRKARSVNSTDHRDANTATPTLAELAAQVRLLQDRRDIEDCVHRYSRGLDRRDWDYLASAYHADAAESRGDLNGTVGEFIDWLKNHMLEWDHSLHMLDVNNVEIRGDVAYAEVYVIFSQQRIDGSAVDFGAARYLDRLERRDGEWKIAHRQLAADWAASAPPRKQSGAKFHVDGRLDTEDLSYRYKAADA